MSRNIFVDECCVSRVIDFEDGLLIAPENQAERGRMLVKWPMVYKTLKNHDVVGCFARHNVTQLRRSRAVSIQLQYNSNSCRRTDTIHISNTIGNNGKVRIRIRGSLTPCLCDEQMEKEWLSDVERVIHDDVDGLPNVCSTNAPVDGSIGPDATEMDGDLGFRGNLNFNHVMHGTVSEEKIQFLGTADADFKYSMLRAHIICENVCK